MDRIDSAIPSTTHALSMVFGVPMISLLSRTSSKAITAWLLVLATTCGSTGTAQTTAEFSGRVVDVNDAPLSGVRIQTSAPVADSPHGRYQAIESIQTDAAGEFKFESNDLPNHPIIGFKKEGYLDRWITPKGAESVTVQLHQPFEITGTVRDYKGVPVTDASVTTVALAEDVFPVLTYPSDDQGNFRIDGLPSLPVRIVVSTDSNSPQLVTVNANNAHAPLKVRLLPGRRIEFFLKNEQGNPISDAAIVSSKWRGHGGIQLRGKTDEQGRCVFRSAPADEVEYRFTHPEHSETIASFSATKDVCEVVLEPASTPTEGIDSGTGDFAYQTLHLCEPDGTVIRPLITNKELLARYCRHGSPNISADGSTIAFDARELIEGYDWTYGHVIVANVDGSNARVVSDGMIPSLSPDGSHVALSRMPKYASKDGARGQSIWTMKCDGTQAKMIADSGAWGVHWTSDGQSLVFFGGRDENGNYVRRNQLRIYDLATRSIRAAWSQEESPFVSMGFHFNLSHRGRLAVINGRRPDGTTAAAVVDLDRGIDSLRYFAPRSNGVLPVVDRTMDFHVSNRFVLVTSGEGGPRHPELWPIHGNSQPLKFPGLPVDREVKDSIITLDGQHLIALINGKPN